MLVLLRNDGKHVEPMDKSSELLVKVLDRTGRHISIIAITEDSNTNEIEIAIEPPLAAHARVVVGDGEERIILTDAEVLAAKGAAAAAESGPES